MHCGVWFDKELKQSVWPFMLKYVSASHSLEQCCLINLKSCVQVKKKKSLRIDHPAVGHLCKNVDAGVWIREYCDVSDGNLGSKRSGWYFLLKDPLKRNKELNCHGDYPIKPWLAAPTQNGCRLCGAVISVTTSKSFWPVHWEVAIIVLQFSPTAMQQGYT